MERLDLSCDDTYTKALATNNPSAYIKRVWQDPSQYFNQYVLPYVRSDLRVLEIGSGLGRYTDLIMPYCSKLYLVEYSDLCLEYLKEHYPSCTTLKVKDVPSFNEQVDLIFSISVMHHFNLFEIWWYFKNTIDNLIDDGYYIIQYFSLRDKGDKVFFMYDYKNFGDKCFYVPNHPEDVERIAKQVGLILIEDSAPRKQIGYGHRFAVFKKGV